MATILPRPLSGEDPPPEVAAAGGTFAARHSGPAPFSARSPGAAWGSAAPGRAGTIHRPFFLAGIAVILSASSPRRWSVFYSRPPTAAGTWHA